MSALIIGGERITHCLRRICDIPNGDGSRNAGNIELRNVSVAHCRGIAERGLPLIEGKPTGYFNFDPVQVRGCRSGRFVVGEVEVYAAGSDVEG